MTIEGTDTVIGAIKAYKTILTALVDKRPSGTRQRLADALGKNRSFITQITSASYPTPLPARHLQTFFSVCHFSAAEQEHFMQAYRSAHPGRLPKSEDSNQFRELIVMVPDLGGKQKNQRFDDMITETVEQLSAYARGNDD